MRFLRLVSLHASLLTLAAAGAATAQDRDEADGWRVTVSPYVWATSLDGHVKLAGRRAPVDVPFSDAFKHLESIAMGDIEVRKGRWAGFVDYQYARTNEGMSLMGLPSELGTRSTTVAGGLAYRLVDSPLGGRTVFGDPRSFRVRPIVGARWSKLRADLNTPLGATSKGVEWTDMLVGLRVEADATDRWTLRGQVDAGGLDGNNRSSRSWQALATYHTPLAGGAVAVNLGYRLLEQNYQQNDFTGQRFDWSVTRHGPIVGLSLTY
nr:hypothetical protein [uncultured Brevundimonas sp.]